MKAFILILAISLNFSTFAVTTSIDAEQESSQLQILDLVLAVTQTYSQTSELNAKVIEVLAGDGMNPTRMVLALSTGYRDTKIFELGIMMYEVRRIVFLNKDVIVINYVQDDLGDLGDMDDSNDNNTQVNKSVTIKVLRNSDGSLANKIEIL